VSGVGSAILEEARLHERAVGLSDIFRTNDLAGQSRLFRVVSDEGLLYEMSLVGNWAHDTDRLMEFDRPARHMLRIHAEPKHFERRVSVLEKDGERRGVELREVVSSYLEKPVGGVLEAVGARNLHRMEEDVSVERFVEMVRDVPGGRAGAMFRYIVVGGEGVQIRENAALAETVHEDVVASLVEDGWKVVREENRVLESDLARRVREYSRGVGILTYWDDATCAEFAEVLEEEGEEDLVRNRQSFWEFIEGVRRGRVSGSAQQFVESKSYPNEPVS